MTLKMRTYPDQNDIMIDIDKISVEPEFETKVINMKFSHQEMIKHEIKLDKEAAENLIKALQYSIDHVGKGLFGAMVFRT